MDDNKSNSIDLFHFQLKLNLSIQKSALKLIYGGKILLTQQSNGSLLPKESKISVRNFL